MTNRRFWPLGLVVVALAATAWTARAGAAPAAPVVPPPSGVAGWQDFVDSLRSLPDRMLAKLPESLRHDPQIQQEIVRERRRQLQERPLW